MLVSVLAALCGCPAGDQIDRPDNGHGAHVDPAPNDPMSGSSGEGGGQAGTTAMMTGGGGSITTGSGGMQMMVMSTGTGGGSGGMPAMTGSGGEGAMPAAMFDAGTDLARNQVTGGHVCARLAQIQCAGEAFCCDNPGRDRAACETAQVATCIQELYLDAITMNAVSGFDPTAAAAAFEGFEQRASQCDPTIASYAASLQGLLGMMKGTVADKGNCSPGLVLDEATAAAYLASCKDIATTACLPKDAVVWSCAARGGEGASCFTDVNCTDGLYCPNPNAEFGTKKCTARKAVGSACTIANECESLYCKGGSCVEATKHAAYCLGEK